MPVQILLPAHNESGNIVPIYDAICKSLEETGYEFSILFVDDGSTDDTLERIKDLASMDMRVQFIELSRNFGHQNAIKAGLDHTDADILIMMDCDLQHPPGVIREMLKWYEQGYDIVRTRRKDTAHIGTMKKLTSRMFYRMLRSVSDIDIEEGSADFRLLSGNAITQLKNFGEYDLFYRGLVKWMGFRQVSIDYEPLPRYSGETKYSVRKMIGFGLKGVTSFSTRPLYFSAYMGVCLSALSLLYIPYVVYALYNDIAIHGWASVIVTIVFFGGINLLILGIIGIYIAKMFYQTKRRPHYIIKESNL
jgi:glycosyltransferase involved in cell wall biosynthesis